VSLDKYLEMIDGRCTGWSNRFGQLVNWQLWECVKGTLPLSLHGELADGGRPCREASRKLKVHSSVNL
jgi:hypothetical protein